MDALVPGSTTARLTARAKINLALHVLGQRPDGYHELESLVVFAKYGDRLEITPSDADRLVITGSFADGVPTDERNLVLRALRLAREVAAEAGLGIPPSHIRLEKNLPHAAGIGGGSADAASLLAYVGHLHPAIRTVLTSRAVELGADVPMCLHGRPSHVRGIGEDGRDIGALPFLPLLLVNPGVSVSTPSVFGALARREWPPLPPVPEAGFGTQDELLAYLAQTRNDLQPPAVSIAPVVTQAIDAVAATGARLSRMSGSGATVFGLFGDEAALRNAATRLREVHPEWWIRETHCAGTGSIHE
ncbi:4-(cytidine 5'-diphospho)-2-C-methyl-D-erythritol kinase [Aureimonas sp. ME7]|uniref:4-(cytidine 5'-diphospho)-2-C-methyl-D-erythritol kinase n=1 Tax=Aureimonas sp. ME7 TaxID=2744252 RepID=UPI0015F3F381|nr:4-(cytidine 5'-diphospho)-2-C-methyl-D-erythritol kinase [Aureimonas sp. ME7]